MNKNESWDNFLRTYPTIDTDTENLQDLFNLFNTTLYQFRHKVLQTVPTKAQQIPPSVCDLYTGQMLFSEAEKAIIAYYAPFAADIRGDIELINTCFNAVLKVPIQIKRIVPFIENVANTPLLNSGWQLNINARLGGRIATTDICFDMFIGPLDKVDLEKYLPQQVLYNFITKGLCPLFLGAYARCRLRLVAKEQMFKVSSQADKTFWDINTKFHSI